MKNVVSARKLVDEMQRLIYTIQNNDIDGGETALKQGTGNVLAALEIFTFANFGPPELENIFNHAKSEIEKHEVITKR